MKKTEKYIAEHKPIRFPTQRPNEHTILLLRRHWLILARDVSHFIILLLLPPILFFLLFQFFEFRIETNSLLYILTVLGLSLYYLYSFLAFFHDFVDYHLDIWVVSDQRILSIEQKDLFKRTISELNLLKIQDVTAEVTGKIQTFVDFGQVYIQTGGTEEHFVFEEVPHPAQVAKIILQAHDRAEKIQEYERVRKDEEIRHAIENNEPSEKSDYIPTPYLKPPKSSI